MPRTGRPRIPVEQRFWCYVDRRGFDECWPWTGSTDPKNGYGIFAVNNGELGLVLTRRNLITRAHRVAFRLVQGRWPEPCGLHGCDNPPCCNAENPEHVHEGTVADNHREMRERGRAVDLRGETAGGAKLTNAQAHVIRARYRAGGTTYEMLAAEYGVSETAIEWIIQGRTYQDSEYVRVHVPRVVPERQQSGEGHFRAKLTNAQVAEIRVRRAAGERQAALAAAFGVTQVSISRYVRGERYGG